MKTNQKIIVIGGGPAGAVIARQLAKSNMEVIVLEANAFPIQKPGECLPPNIKPLLRKLELTHLLSKHKHSYSNEAAWGSNKIVDENFIYGIHGTGTHINRTLFEQDLANEAQNEGVIWYNEHTLRKCSRINNEWHLEVDHLGNKKEFLADFIVDASGRKSIVSRHLNTKREVLDKLVGVSVIVTGNTVLNSATLIETCANGWWYSASLPSNKLVVSFMTDSDQIIKLKANQNDGFNKLLQETNHIKKRVEHCLGHNQDIAESLNIHAANSSRLKQITGKGWLAVGDAACTYDPLSSYGITAAIATAYYGACAIKSHFEEKSESFLTYNYLMDKMYGAYLPLVTNAYYQERRWENSVFWKRRHL